MSARTTTFAALAGVVLAAIAAPNASARSPVILEGADDDMRDAISALLPDRDDPETLFDAERLADEAAEHANAWLRSEGYYAGTAEAVATDTPPRASVRLTPGARFRLGAPSVAYDGAAPDAAAQAGVTDALRLAREGAPARASDVLAAEAAAVASLQGVGYVDAIASPRRVVVDHAAATMTPAYRFVAGPRVRLGALRAEPADLLRPGFVADVINWEPGEIYAPEHLRDLRRNIAATGAVSRVNTRLEQSPVAADIRDVVLELEPAARNAYELGFGYSTTEGIGVDAEWTRRNFSHRADTLRLATTLGELRQSLTAELTRPHAAGLNRTVRFTASANREDTTAYERTGFSLAGAVDAARRLRYGVSYGASVSADEYQRVSGVETAYVLGAFGEVRRDTTGNPLDARDGDIVEFRVEPAISAGDATVTFLRSTLEARTYESLGADERTTLAARVRVGAITALSGDNEDLPPDRRFYAGGGGSVRGYTYNSIYPDYRKLPNVTPGGEALIEVSAEARRQLGGPFGIAAFVDGGNAFDSWSDAADLRWGVGVGLRYNLGFAPLRVDLAVPLNGGDDDPSYALYVSLGQAF